MDDPLILYSTNTWLAFAIAERYYNHLHYVWCSPFFSPRPDIVSVAMPPTAIPGEIYESLGREVKAGDRHSAWIEKNKVGILRGASAKKLASVISHQQETDIASIVELSQVSDFRPLLYVMPFAQVRHLVREVPPAERAHPLSIEYRIEVLPTHLFDVIQLRRR